eukprot:COSAG05_NODE_297_length_11939_cov_17.362753_10_plen_349_part_00
MPRMGGDLSPVTPPKSPMGFQADDPDDDGAAMAASSNSLSLSPAALSFEEPSGPPPQSTQHVSAAVVPPSAGFTTAAIVSPVTAEPTVVDAKVVQSDDSAGEMWGDLLRYQVQCCGCRIGLKQAKRLMFLMGGVILVLTCCVVGAAVMVSNDDTKGGQQAQQAPRPPPRPPAQSQEEREQEPEEEDEGPDPCSPSPCHHGGECEILDGASGQFQCRCPAGKVGTHCEVNLETCNSNPCQNDAECVDGANRFVCICAAGFSGSLCDEDQLAEELSRCEHLNCLHGGECHPEGHTGRVLCECPIGYSGDRCENKHKDIALGHGIDITSALKNNGEFSLKFAGIFSGRNRR